MIFSVFQKIWVFGYSWSTLLWYRCYYPHRSRDALSPVCGIFYILVQFSLVECGLLKNSAEQSYTEMEKVEGTCEPDMEKDNFFTPARFEQKLFYPRKCVTCDKSEFATKQRKMCLTTSMSKIRLPHIYRSNNYVIIEKKILF